MWPWNNSRPPNAEAAGQNDDAPLIDVRHLRLRRQRRWRVDRPDPGLSFSLCAGECLAVLGDNGSGKSLLLNFLAGVYLPPGPDAAVRIAGRDLRERAARRWVRARMGVVFQQPALVHALTVFENVALPLRQSPEARWSEEEIEAQVGRLLGLVGVSGLEEDYPRELSEGLQGCVALARALAGGKRILICDEPTAGLSPDKAYQIDELLAWLMRSGALDAAVIFTQNLQSALRVGTRFLLLGSGARFGEGKWYSHAEALRNCAQFQRFLQHPDDAPFFPAASPDASFGISSFNDNADNADDADALPASLRNCL